MTQTIVEQTLYEHFAAAAQRLRSHLERVPDQAQIVASEARRLILRCPGEPT